MSNIRVIWSKKFNFFSAFLPKKYKIELKIKEDINVNIEANTLTISYTEEETTETSFACSSFRRSWRLPEGTDVENITATYHNGILSLSVPTADAATYTRTIEVEWVKKISSALLKGHQIGASFCMNKYYL